MPQLGLGLGLHKHNFIGITYPPSCANDYLVQYTLAKYLTEYESATYLIDKLRGVTTGITDGRVGQRGTSLDGDGTMYVKQSAIIPTQTTKLRVWGDFNSLSVPSVNQRMGQNTAFTVNSYEFGTNGAQWRLIWGNTTFVGGTADTEKHKFEVSNGELFVDDAKVCGTEGGDVGTPENPIWLNAVNANGVAETICNFNCEKAEIEHAGNTYKFDFEETNTDTTVYGVAEDGTFITGEIQNATGSDRVQTDDVVSQGDLSGYVGAIRNEIENYDFSDGTTGWTATLCTLTESNNIAEVIENGQFSRIEQQATLSIQDSSDVWFLFMNASADNAISIYGTNGVGNIATHSGNGSYEDVYDMFINTTGGDVSIRWGFDVNASLITWYLNGNINNGGGVFALNLAAIDRLKGTDYASMTAEQINAIKYDLLAMQTYSDPALTNLVPTGVKLPVRNNLVSTWISDGLGGSYQPRYSEVGGFSGEMQAQLVYTDAGGTPSGVSPYIKQANKKWKVVQADKLLNGGSGLWYDHTDPDNVVANVLAVADLLGTSYNNSHFVGLEWIQVFYNQAIVEPCLTEVRNFVGF